MSSFGGEAPILIQTKLHRPQLSQDIIPRPHLIQLLNQGVNCKVTLISAQAGAGKSTLLAQWLEQCSQRSTWLSLDEEDNNLVVFVSYLCAAIQTVFPDACSYVLDLLHAPLTPPSRIITTSLVNELDALCRSSHDPDIDSSAKQSDETTRLIIALDDFHSINEPAIHELVSELVQYLPQCVHLALSTRTDPSLPLAGLRSRKEMTELRTNDLQMTIEEAGKLLELTAGRKLSNDTVNLIREKTEGWLVGLRLAGLSIRDLPEDTQFAGGLEGTSSSIIADYLISEVLSRQSAADQDFLLRSSILNRFNDELCDALIWSEVDVSPPTNQPGFASSTRILKDFRSTNLFLISLDQEERWFRYHHLFRGLLHHRLQSQHDPAFIRILHSRASQWFEENGFIEEALSHAFTADDLERAAGIVARQRYSLMNRARWQRLDRYLGRFPPEFAGGQPDLLMLKAWLLYHQMHYNQLPLALEEVEAALIETPQPLEITRHLKAEIGALRSLLYYYQTDIDRTAEEADFAIRNTAPELWIVRILARLFLASAYQMKGDLHRAYEIVYQGVDEENLVSDRYRATMLATVAYVYWIAADLPGLIAVTAQALKIGKQSLPTELRGFAHYHLGSAYYQQNDLVRAEQHFLAVTRQPYLNYGEGFAHSAFGLSLTYLAQDRLDMASQMAEMVTAHMMETDNTTLLPIAWAFQAELALRQDQISTANQWAAQFDSIPPLSPKVRFYYYHFTLAKIWLANNTKQSRKRATGLLNQLREYMKATRNTHALAEVLALQAILSMAENDEPAALQELESAIELAQPGGWIRLFVDLGPSMARMLQELHDKRQIADDLRRYIAEILAAFEKSVPRKGQIPVGNSPRPSPDLVEPLTIREMEVLELLARRLSNKEIAKKLVISPGTVKTHTLSIYAKLDVHSRIQAVDKALEIGLLSPN